MSDGSGRLALRACQENSPRPSGPCRPAGGVAVCLPGGRRNRLDGHDRGQALQGFAAVRRSVLEGAYGSRSMTGAPIAPGAATPLCARGCESIRPSRWENLTSDRSGRLSGLSANCKVPRSYSKAMRAWWAALRLPPFSHFFERPSQIVQGGSLCFGREANASRGQRRASFTTASPTRYSHAHASAPRNYRRRASAPVHSSGRCVSP